MAEPTKQTDVKPEEAQSTQAAPTPVSQTSQDSKSASSSKKGLIIIAVVLVAIIIVAAIAYNALASSAAPEHVTQTAQTTQGGGAANDAEDDATPAPDFAMTTVDGEELTLSSLQGRPVVLNFWASTCGPCRQEMPEFQSAYEEYGDQIAFVMVNVPDYNGETRDRALSLIEESGYTFPVYFPVGDEASIAYGITSIPRTYFIAADGIMVAYASGSIDGETIAQGIDMILE